MSNPGFFGRLAGLFSRDGSRSRVPPAALPVRPERRPEPSPPRTPALHPMVTKPVDPSVAAPIVVPPRPVAVTPASVPAAVGARPVDPLVAAFVADVETLPLFSGTAMQLMRSVGDESISSTEVARLIGSDAGLTAQLLRIVNSAHYALPRPCATVADAITVLGFARVRRTVAAAVTQGPLTTYLRDSRVVQAFFRHQLLCAAMARHLAIQRGLDGEVAYMGGLMHEIGRLAILIRHPHLTDVLLNVEGKDDHLGKQHERRHFGFDHAQVGGALLGKWGLPDAILEAVYDHESDTQPADPVSAAVWRANLLAHDLIESPDELEQPLPWMAAVGLSLEGRTAMLEEIKALEGQH